MYTPRDVEVFLFAHDRPAFLREALDSYLRQTVGGFRLALLANAPTPEVLQVAKEYAGRGVELILEPQSLNVYGCVRRCQELASRSITVLAHDDDWVHPAYLETLLKCYNRFAKLQVAVSAAGEWDARPFTADYHTQLVLLNPAEFSAYIFTGEPFAFSSSSYKTEFFKTAPAPDFARYGKVNDVPFMLGVCRGGEAAVLQFPFVKCRIHPRQDSLNFATGPRAREWIELDLCHKREMSQGGRKLRWAYILNAFHRLKTGWRDWCVCEHDKMTFKQYLNLARQMGALDAKRRFFGVLLRGGGRKACLEKLCSFVRLELK